MEDATHVPSLRARPGRPVEFRTRDVDEARLLIQQNFYPNRVDILRPSEAFAGSVAITQLGRVTVGDLRFTSDLRMQFGELGHYHVDLPLTGSLVWHQGRREAQVAAAARDAAVFQPVGDTTLDEWYGGTRLLAVKIERAALETELERLLDTPLRLPLQLAPGMDLTQDAGRSWQRLALTVAQEAHTPGGLGHHPLIADRLAEALVTGLLLAVDHPYHARLTQPVPPCRPAPVKRAVDAIEAHPDHPYTVAALSRIAGVSVRWLQQGFRYHIGLSPMAYLRQVRLARAHDELRGSGPGQVTVTEVAHRWGFMHLSRFAAVYRRRYGVSPSMTLHSV